jgi:hypothetical protein
VRENILALVIGRDEAEALFSVEPLDGTCCHYFYFLLKLEIPPDLRASVYGVSPLLQKSDVPQRVASLQLQKTQHYNYVQVYMSVGAMPLNGESWATNLWTWGLEF